MIRNAILLLTTWSKSTTGDGIGEIRWQTGDRIKDFPFFLHRRYGTLQGPRVGMAGTGNRGSTGARSTKRPAYITFT